MLIESGSILILQFSNLAWMYLCDWMNDGSPQLKRHRLEIKT